MKNNPKYSQRIFAVALMLICIATLAAMPGCDKFFNKRGNIKTPADLDKYGIEPSDREIFIWLEYDQQTAESIIDAYTVAYPDYKIKYNYMDEITLSRMNAAITSGSQPDVFNSKTDWSVFYYGGTLFELQAFIDRDPEFLIDGIHPIVRESNTVNGKLYALSPTLDLVCLVWNPLVYENAGLEPDTCPKSWDEMLELQTYLTQYNTKGIVIRTGIICPLPYDLLALTIDGKSIVKDNRYQYNYFRQAYIDAVEFSRNLEDKYGKDALPIAGVSFERSNVAMTMMSGDPKWTTSTLEFMIAPFPTKNGAENIIPASQSNYWMLPRDAANLQAGWHFIKWMLTDGFLGVTEMEKFDLNPDTYTTSYHILESVRKKTATEFKEFMLEQNASYADKRNSLLDQANSLLIMPGLQNDEIKALIDEYILPSLDNRSTSIRELLRTEQKTLDDYSDQFVSNQSRKGWDFTQGFGIPPWEEQTMD